MRGVCWREELRGGAHESDDQQRMVGRQTITGKCVERWTRSGHSREVTERRQPGADERRPPGEEQQKQTELLTNELTINTTSILRTFLWHVYT